MISLVLLFILFGSFVGCFVFWETAMISLALNFGDSSAFSPEALAKMQNETISDKLAAVFIVGPFMASIGYPFALFLGTIPATATALSYWLTLRCATQKNPAPTNRALIGGLLGLVVAVAYGVMKTQVSKSDVVFLILMWAIPGFVASASCAVLVGNSWYSKIFPTRLN